MSRNAVPGFFALYALHAVAHLMHSGWIHSSWPFAATAALSLGTLIALFVLVAWHIAHLDEVVLLMCLKAATISLSVVVLAGYSLVAVFGQAGLLGWLWALALFLFLVVYGGLWWRARS